VLVPYHTVGIAAKANSFLLPARISSTDGFIDFLQDRQIQALYIDNEETYSSDVVRAALARFPEAFTLYYDSPEDRIQIYLVNENIQPASE
jgi:hypothetical protein